MRLDPSHIGDPLRQLGGGAVDASQGQRAAREAAGAEREAAFEPLDKLMLKRLRALELADAASTVKTYADAREVLARTRELSAADPSALRGAQADLARDRLRQLLGE